MCVSLLHWFGYGLCHQLPERSFFGGGIQVPVCARDTGIYIGFVVSVLVIVAVQRNRPSGLPSLGTSLLLGAFVLFMAWDGLTSYSGLRGTTNAIRLVSGVLAGYAMGAVALPLVNDMVWRTASSDRVLGTSGARAWWLASIVACIAGVWWVAPALGPVYPLLVVAAVLGTLTIVNLLLVSLARPFERRARQLKDAWLAILIAFGLAWLEVGLSAALRVGLERLIGG